MRLNVFADFGCKFSVALMAIKIVICSHQDAKNAKIRKYEFLRCLCAFAEIFLVLVAASLRQVNVICQVDEREIKYESS